MTNEALAAMWPLKFDMPWQEFSPEGLSDELVEANVDAMLRSLDDLMNGYKYVVFATPQWPNEERRLTPLGREVSLNRAPGKIRAALFAAPGV